MATTTVMLSNQALNDISSSTNVKVNVPKYNRESLSAGIVHFGVGNFHRSHQVSQIVFYKKQIKFKHLSFQKAPFNLLSFLLIGCVPEWTVQFEFGTLGLGHCWSGYVAVGWSDAPMFEASGFSDNSCRARLDRSKCSGDSICEFIRNILDESFFLKI